MGKKDSSNLPNPTKALQRAFGRLDVYFQKIVLDCGNTGLGTLPHLGAPGPKGVVSSAGGLITFTQQILVAFLVLVAFCSLFMPIYGRVHTPVPFNMPHCNASPTPYFINHWSEAPEIQWGSE